MPRKYQKKDNPLQLIADYQSTGETRYVQQLHQLYHDKSMGVFVKYTSDREQSKDLNQNLFLMLLEKLKTAKVSNYPSWLVAVCRNMAIDYTRRRDRERNKSDKYKKDKEIEDERMVNPEIERLEDIQLELLTQEQLDDALARLSPDQRACIEAVYTEGLTYKETANKLGIQHRQVKTKLQNALYHLRRNVKRYPKLVILASFFQALQF